MTEIEVKERYKWIADKLKRGRTAASLIPVVAEKFGIAESTAYNNVYEVNGLLNKSLKELTEKSADYVITNLQRIVEDTTDAGETQLTLKALDQIAKATKLYNDRDQQDVNINIGFDFGE